MSEAEPIRFGPTPSLAEAQEPVSYTHLTLPTTERV